MPGNGFSKSRYRMDSDERGIDTDTYTNWRNKIFCRDKYYCQMPGCKRKGRCVHHIRKWAEYPSLRFDVDNGITLCSKCHKIVTQKEDSYVTLFAGIIATAKTGDNYLEILSMRFLDDKEK